MTAPTTTTSVPHAGTYPAGPLTTAFKPTDSYCSTGSYRYDTTICMPTRWNLYYSAASYYSPAICPYAWRSAAAPPSGFGPPLEPTETGVVCCPTGFTLSSSSSSYFSCLSSTVFFTTSYLYTYIASRSSYSTTSSSSFYTTSTLYGYAIQVRWAATDLPSLETDPIVPDKTPTRTSTTSTTSPTSTNGSGTSIPTPVPSNGGGLGSGAKAGIGIGAALIFILILAAIFILFRRRRNYNQQPNISDVPETPLSLNAQSPVVEKAISPTVGSAPPYSSTHSSPSNYAPPPLGNSVQDEYRRVQERKSRLVELQRLEEEEERLRNRILQSNAPPNLPELGYGNK